MAILSAWLRPCRERLLRRMEEEHCYSRGSTFGGSVTSMLPFASRSSVGAYKPSSCRCHHIPDARLSAIVVNQYCQSTARTCFGGSFGKGLPAKSANTSWSLASNRTSVFGTIKFSRHCPSDANQRFQSNRG